MGPMTQKDAGLVTVNIIEVIRLFGMIDFLCSVPGLVSKLMSVT